MAVVPNDAPELPARIRRLTNAEYEASVRALFNVQGSYAKSFAPDARQTSFTRNDAQRIDPVLVMQLDDAATKIAAELRPQIQNLAYCQNPNAVADAEACARTFVTTYAGRAYRRPTTPREIDALLTVYRAAKEGGTYQDGIEATIHALLMAPGFLYVTELGEAATAAATRLTPYETAASLSYLLTGAPPDDALAGAARDGKLTTGEERRAQATRLLSTDPARIQFVRVVEEWLGIDAIIETSKDSNAHPDFMRLRDSMKKEADAFIKAVLFDSNGTVADLLGADWTVAEDDLARMYLKLDGNQQVPRQNNRVSLAGTKRRGILGQAAFLSVYSHAIETAPVLRGVAVARRITCDDVPPPSTANVNAVPPVPDPAKTTRERFTAHVVDEVCKGCHSRIDPLGFSFENLDAMGKERPTENNKPVDTVTTVTASKDFNATYMDSTQLAAALAASTTAKNCFARHLFRYSAARSDASVRGAEAAFVEVWNGLPAASQGKLSDVVLAYVGSDQFVARRVEK